jgi:type I restriction enzyme S subunit
MQILHGASGLVTKQFDGMKISGSYISVVSRDKDIFDIEYLDWLSKTSRFYHQTYISSYGVAIEKMTFQFEYFLEQEITIPEINEQKAIVEVLRAATKEIEKLSNLLDAYKEQKKGLMQKLLMGEIIIKSK